MTTRSSATDGNTTARAALEQAESCLTPERDGNRAAPVWGLPSTAAIVGHPIHPMMIPYPIAFLTAVVATDLAARATRDPFWSRASRLLLGAGIASGARTWRCAAVAATTRPRPAAKSR